LRIEYWIRTVLLDEESNKDNQLLVYHPKADTVRGRNLHSLHLLQFLFPKYDPKIARELPSFVYLETDNSIDEQEMILQQCIQGNELNWGSLAYKWNSFSFSLDYLMKLVRVYHQPLKLLSVISPSSLFRLLENLKKERFYHETATLKSQIKNELAMTLVILTFLFLLFLVNKHFGGL
jgi:hypothetical protein